MWNTLTLGLGVYRPESGGPGGLQLQRRASEPPESSVMRKALTQNRRGEPLWARTSSPGEDKLTAMAPARNFHFLSSSKVVFLAERAAGISPRASASTHRGFRFRKGLSWECFRYATTAIKISYRINPFLPMTPS